MSRIEQQEKPIFFLEVKNLEGEEDENLQISSEFLSRNLSNALTLTNLSREYDLEYETDDEMSETEVEGLVQMIKSDPDDNEIWTAFLNDCLTFTRVSSKEHIE